jgi:hypothetical protein
MIYITSARSLIETLPIISACNKYDTYEAAKRYAESFVQIRNQPCYIYQLEGLETIEPPKLKRLWMLEFNRIESEQTTVEAENLAEAIETARKNYPKADWDLIRSYMIEEK